MIIWVNGAFGSGKTTLVDALRRQRPDALVYDPERIGDVLRDIVDVPTGDYQDLRLWRRQVVSMAMGLLEEYERPLLVPMTLVDPRYVAEIFGVLEEAGAVVHHFFLKVSPEVLARRIDTRPGSTPADRQWCKEQIEHCVAAADALPTDTVFLDGERPCEELVHEVLTRVGMDV